MAVTFDIRNKAGTTIFDMQGTDADRITSTRLWTPNGEITTEVWEIVIKDTAANIRNNIQDLTDLAAMAREWQQDKLQDSEIVLRWRTEGEGIKQSLIHKIEITPLDDTVIDIDLSTGTAKYRIAITRDTAWTSDTALTSSNVATHSSLGGQWNLSGSRSGGDYPAYLGITSLQASAGNGTLDKLWLGIHPLREWGTPIQTLLELEDGVMGTDTSSITETAASGGNTAECTFATQAGMKHRVSYAFSSTDHSQSGYYHVLLRARLDSSTTIVGVRMSLGFLAFGDQVPHSKHTTQYIDGSDGGTLYALIPMGTVMLPPTGLRDPMGFIGAAETSFWSNLRFHIEAQRISGTGKLRLDALILIPAEHSVYVDKMNLAATEWVRILADQEGNMSAITENSGSTSLSNYPIVSDTGMYPYTYPREGGILVVAAQRDKNSYKDDDFQNWGVSQLYYKYNLYL